MSDEPPILTSRSSQKNWECLLAGDIALAFLLSVMGNPAIKRRLSKQHFFGRWHADRRVSLDEELPAQIRQIR
ncbi:hypothetical protein ACELLULO517_23085 [Acidisoma cellulosilytica]|uniref:Uncharacterized protein n=1 Tax=Acidisoma cellulosilyticum TaxID=2802395 RepID=A0A963Z5U9_9PROT|nr:hypothetical protein [Acidisoma cellulosilyticum]MCB8883153.1 hypothetical protein [Acidisoma cellulosilyticum]